MVATANTNVVSPPNFVCVFAFKILSWCLQKCVHVKQTKMCARLGMCAGICH